MWFFAFYLFALLRNAVLPFVPAHAFSAELYALAVLDEKNRKAPAAVLAGYVSETCAHDCLRTEAPRRP